MPTISGKDGKVLIGAVALADITRWTFNATSANPAYASSSTAGYRPMALTLSILWERLVFGMRFALGEDILQITAKMSGPSHGICSKSVDR
jgi:hypothetical protein